MTYQLFFTNRARKDIQKLTGSIKTRIIKALKIISADPHIGKALKTEYQGLFSFRVGDYRIIYQIHKKEIVVIILKIGHRKSVYR